MWLFKKDCPRDEAAIYEREIARQSDKIGKLEDELTYIKSRILGIQQHGKPNGKGEVMYNVQAAKGQYTKCFLPEVK